MNAGFDIVSTLRHDTYPAIDPRKADLSGKVVLIAGASKGIGRATALALAQAGVSGLALLARSDLKETEAACRAVARSGQQLRVLTIAVDTTNDAQVTGAAQQVKDTFGRLDVLVNNAGFRESYRLTCDSDPEEWWKVWKVNVLGTYLVTRAFLPLLVECGGERTIVNVGSIAGLVVGGYNSAYMTTKLALLRFTELLVAEYSNKGIISFSVHPGSILTDMSAELPESKKHLLVDTLELASHTIVWLVKERRDWLSGRYVSCQWDVEEFSAKRQEVIDGDKLKVRLVM